MSTLKIAIIQMNSSPVVENNQSQVLDYLDRIKEDADLIFFPETTLSINVQPSGKPKGIALEDEFFQKLVQKAKDLNVEMQMCTPLLRDAKTYNASFWISAQGIEDIYDKINLFKVHLPNQDIDEGLAYQAGNKLCLHETKNWKIASSICYDVRYANIYAAYAQSGAGIISVPSAFTVKTGQDHWETLLRSRAIESQSFIVAPAQTGTHTCKDTKTERKTYGHSMVIDPWGNVLLDAGVQPGVYYATLDKRTLEKTRKILPIDRKSPCPSF